MILINTRTNEAYTNCYPTFAARMIGVDGETARRWKRSGCTFKAYEHWRIYFKEIEVKQDKGFKKSP